MKPSGMGLLASCVLFVAQALLCPFASSAGVSAGSTALSAQTSSGQKIEATILASRPASDFLFRKRYIWGGDESEPPALLIEAIEITVAGEEVFVPLSAFADLGSPKMASIAVSGSGFELRIVGGDAGGAYDAILSFDGPWLIRRRVSSRSFPDDAWEETNYAFNRN